jgi:competence protein ComFC
MLCEGFSLSHICRRCQNEHLQPSLHKRKILGKIPVFSFYKYNEIEFLLHTKHTELGYYIYTLLADNAMKPFAKTFDYEQKVAALPVDDHVRHGYSHTALLARSLRTRTITPRYGRVRATSKDSYSGQNYQYRLLHPRKFRVRPFEEEEVILVDDILTTGLTLTQAAEALNQKGKKVLFCLTLADAEKA